MSIGFVLPFSVTTGSLGYFATTDDELTAVNQNIRSLLMTNRGERVMHYDFGCDLRKILFEPRTEELKISVADRINSQIERWLPFISLEGLNILFDDDYPEVPSNGIGIVIAYRLKNKPDKGSTVSIMMAF